MARKKITYDFREGLETDKIVYKNRSRCDCLGFLFYVLYLLATWSWAAATFALFYYGWINHEIASFWAFIAGFIIVAGGFWTYSFVQLGKYYKKRADKRRQKKIDNERRTQEENDKIQRIIAAKQQIEMNEIKPIISDNNYFISEPAEKKNLVNGHDD